MTAIVLYEQARSAIERCHRIDEAKDIADKAAALRIYARQANDPDMEAWVAEIRLRAKQRIGELSAALETAQGFASICSGDGTNTKSETLAAAGLSRTEAHRCEQIATVPRTEFEAYIAGKRALGRAVSIDEVLKLVKKTRRKSDVEQQGEAATLKTRSLSALAGQRFGTIYADPPWLYGNQGTRGATGDHYVGLAVDEICKLPIAELAADNAHLHLWTTNAFLFDAQRVIEAWGFEYRSCYVWVKPQIGMGNYWRVSHEFLLLGIRGSCPFADRSLRSWGEFERSRHSAKPEQIRALIEKASPGPRLELFGRRTAPGWVVWGNEIETTLLDAGVQELVA